MKNYPQPKYLVLLFVFTCLLVQSCVPKYSYRFSSHAKRPVSAVLQQKKETIPIADNLVVSAVSPVGESEMLEYDKDRLTELAQTHGARISFTQDSTVVYTSVDTLLKEKDQLFHKLSEIEYSDKEKIEKAASRYDLSLTLILLSLFSVILSILLPVTIPFFIRASEARKRSDAYYSNLKDPEFVAQRRKKRIRRVVLGTIGILVIMVAAIALLVYAMGYRG